MKGIVQQMAIILLFIQRMESPRPYTPAPTEVIVITANYPWTILFQWLLQIVGTSSVMHTERLPTTFVDHLRIEALFASALEGDGENRSAVTTVMNVPTAPAIIVYSIQYIGIIIMMYSLTPHLARVRTCRSFWTCHARSSGWRFDMIMDTMDVHLRLVFSPPTLQRNRGSPEDSLIQSTDGKSAKRSALLIK